MPRTETYLLRLTKEEKAELAQRAKLQDISIAKLIRERLKLDAERTWGGKPPASPGVYSKDRIIKEQATIDPSWKKLLPPS